MIIHVYVAGKKNIDTSGHVSLYAMHHGRNGRRSLRLYKQMKMISKDDKAVETKRYYPL